MLGALAIACYLAWPHVRGSLHWRLLLWEGKATGELPQLYWSELASMTLGVDRFEVGGPTLEGRSIDASVHNPYTTAADIAAGHAIFNERCSVCHGANAGGGHGPSLLRANYTHANTPFAIYRVLRDGVRSTAMVPTNLQPKQRWQVIAYFTNLRRQAGVSPEQVARIAPFDIKPADLVAAGARTDQWLTYSGSYNGNRYTPLAQITPANVANLKLRWIRQFPSESTTQVSTPLVIGRTMFMSEAPSNAVALDTRTGEILWRYERGLPKNLSVCCGAINRGLAVLGNTLYLTTLDSRLVALDAVNGAVRWEAEVAKWTEGYSMTAAPLVVGNSVVVGVSGGEYAIRGFLAAYDSTTGKLQWRFDTVPGPGETGHETWGSDAWKSGGGATWVTGSYDPELDLIYWGVGNPSPVYQAAVRPGDNLFTASVIALHAKTGKLAWYFQFSPHDEHDWDAAQTPVLVDLDLAGGKRKVLCWPNRNGFYYVLDRVTGQFISATPFARQNWALDIDATGRPIPDPARKVTQDGVLTFPSAAGAANWQPAAYDPVRKLVYVHANDQGAVFTNTAPGNVTRGATNIYVASSAASAGNPVERVRALEAATGKLRWERPQDDMRSSGGSAGLLATGGGLVFGANRGYVFALDSDTGREVWRLALGESTASPPISFEIDGQQVVGLWSGRSYFMFGL